jgi:hypothetical protein
MVAFRYPPLIQLSLWNDHAQGIADTAHQQFHAGNYNSL